MNNKIYVGNLSFDTTEGDLRDAFGQFGSVTEIHRPSDRDTGQPKGFAFVTFSTEAESDLAAEKMNGVEFAGRMLTVNKARLKTESDTNRNFGPNRRAGAFQARYKGRR
jgi:cold-inducible RNA-binding protein